MIKVGIVTVSDRCAAGRRPDESGNYLKRKIRQAGWQVFSYEVIPDDEKTIVRVLKQFTDQERLDLVLTTGGTGLARRDVTPEATRQVLEKEISGIPEAMRMQTFRKSPFSVLSRAVAGVRKKTLIINLPGSPRGVEETLAVIQPVIPHALETIREEKVHHDRKR